MLMRIALEGSKLTDRPFVMRCWVRRQRAKCPTTTTLPYGPHQ